MGGSTLEDLRPRAPDRLSRGALLAIAAHVLLVIALTFSIDWRSSEPAGIEAELWAAVPQVAAPRAVEPDPPKPAPPKPAPPEPPQPAPRVEPPPPPPNRDAEIAREKREQEQRLLKQRQEEERKEAQRRAQQEQERKELERKEQERKRAEAAKRDAERKRQAELEKQREAELQQQREAAETARIEAQREAALKRIQGELSGTGAPGSPGTAARTAGPSAGYAGRIKGRILPNIVYTEEVAGNPLAQVEVQVAPDGRIVGRKLVKASGVAAWDEAVLRAVDKTEVLPRDTDGTVPPTILLDFKPRDL